MGTASNASEYAESVVAGIRADVEAGAPFGYVNRDDDATADRLTDIDGFDADEHDADNLPDGWELGTGADYVDGALDLRYIVNGDRSYRSGHVVVTVGGPNAYVDTDTREFVVSWGFETVRRPLPAPWVALIDDALGEYWEMGA